MTDMRKRFAGSAAGTTDRRASLLISIAILAALVLLNKAATGDLARYLANPRLQLFTILLLAILLEGLPFLLVGSLISGAIEVLVPGRILEERVFPRRPLPAAAVGALLGVVFPVCSCGNVPVCRRLLRKGVPAAGAVSYLLAAPVINPITLAATVLAFPQARGMVWGRAALACAVAVSAALLIGRSRDDILLPGDLQPEHSGECPHVHSGGRLSRILGHAEQDFLLTGRFLVLGTSIAAFLQTVIPRAAFVSVSAKPLVSTALMELLGVAFSLCSFADAFVASTFTGLPSAAKAAFLVAGPMAGGSLIVLYLGSFRRRFAVRLVACVLSLIFLLASLWGFIGRGV